MSPRAAAIHASPSIAPAAAASRVASSLQTRSTASSGFPTPASRNGRSSGRPRRPTTPAGRLVPEARAAGAGGEGDRLPDRMSSGPAQHRIRVLIAKPGLDGHDRGAKVVARALRDAGMEVIYTGLRQSPEQIVAAAAQEDVDAIGLSILSGAHLPICRRVIELLKEKGMEGVQVFLGGIIPAQDIPELKRMGVAEVFLPGASTQDVIKLIQGAIHQ